MERNKISIEHLYDPAKLGVDQVYEDVFEGFEHSYWFALENQKLIKFFNSCKIEDCIFILVKSYLKKYASTRIIDVYGYLTESKKEGIIKRKDLDIDWFPNRRLDIIEVKFLKNVKLQLLKTAIEDGLDGKQSHLIDNVYKVLDSPIDTITFSESSFTLKCHQSKVINY